MYSHIFKKGTTLSLVIQRRDEDNQPLTGDASKLRSQIRTPEDLLVGSFVITETSTPGDYLFEIPSSVTNTFPLGLLEWDIEYNDGSGYIKTTDTMTIKVVRAVTR